jgi:general secretion pathway protein A
VGAAAMAAVQWGGRDKAASRVAVAASAASSGLAAPARPPALVASALPSVAASASRLRSIDDLESVLAGAPHDEHDALRTLGREWSLLLVDGDPCALAAEQDVRCFRAHGGLALLRLLARPSVLALRDAQDRSAYVVLTGLGHDDATLLVGKTPMQVPLTLLTTAWRGDFTTLWRVPAGYSVPLALGSRGALVDAVGAQLAAQQGASAPAPDHVFDATLRSRVDAFQQAQGLTPDGVAGPTTLMQINRASGVPEPWLAGTAPAAAAAPVAQRK